jgi:hypothetical protein
VLLVSLEQLARQLDQPHHPRVRDPVVDGSVFAPSLHEPAPAQACQMVGDVRLCELQPTGELADRHLALLGEEIEDAQPRAVREDAEVLGEELLLGGGIREAKRGVYRSSC